MKNDIYICDKCGNMIEMLHDSGNTVICCGEAMRKVEKGAKENAYEKHNPVITIKGNKITVKIGEVEHPMTEEHYIEYIEVLTDKNERLTSFIKDKPEAIFKTENEILKEKDFCVKVDLGTKFGTAKGKILLPVKSLCF